MSWVKEKPDEKNKNVKIFVHSDKHKATELRYMLWEACQEAQIKPEILTSPIVDSETGDFLEVCVMEITSADGKAATARKVAEELVGLGIENDLEKYLEGKKQ